MSDITEKNFFDSPDIARKLDISESTLRKYSLILEKSGWSFSKNERSGRIFTDLDIKLLTMFLRLKNELSMSLEVASDMSVSYFRTSDTLTQEVATQIDQVLQQKNENKIIQEFRHVYEKLEQKSEEEKKLLQEEVSQVRDDYQDIKKQLQEVLNYQNQSFFRKLFPKKKSQ